MALSLKERARLAYEREQASEREKGEATQPQVNQKVQTAGPTRVLEQTLAIIGIARSNLIDISAIKIPDGYQRDPSEFETPEFNELVESIRSTNGNMDPIDLREVEGSGGSKYTLITGTRRLEACKRIGREQVLANIRILDDKKADILHDIENAKRAEKRPYSLALQLKAMMESGRYANQADLAQSLGRDAGALSKLIRVISDAPEGFWSSIKDPSEIAYRDIDQLLKAFKVPAFITYVRALAPKSTPVSTLMDKVKAVLAKPKPAAANKSLSERIIEKKRGKDYIIQIPGEVSSELRMKAINYIKELVGSGE
jgi:ParB family chromosome partitioning protein